MKTAVMAYAAFRNGVTMAPIYVGHLSMAWSRYSDSLKEQSGSTSAKGNS